MRREGTRRVWRMSGSVKVVEGAAGTKERTKERRGAPAQIAIISDREGRFDGSPSANATVLSRGVNSDVVVTVGVVETTVVTGVEDEDATLVAVVEDATVVARVEEEKFLTLSSTKKDWQIGSIALLHATTYSKSLVSTN
jgi:hypothetical protein